MHSLCGDRLVGLVTSHGGVYEIESIIDAHIPILSQESGYFIGSITQRACCLQCFIGFLACRAGWLSVRHVNRFP